MISGSRIMMVCLSVVLAAYIVLDRSPRAHAQGDRPGRYAIVASHPGGSGQPCPR